MEGASSHTHTQKSAYKNCIRFDALLSTIAGKCGAMATPAPTYSYPHVTNRKLTCHITFSALGHTVVYCAPPHFIVNLDLTLKHNFLSSKRVRQIKIRVPYGTATSLTLSRKRVAKCTPDRWLRQGWFFSGEQQVHQRPHVERLAVGTRQFALT